MAKKSSQLITFENGFTFPFLGKEYTEMYLGSNGFITFEKQDKSGSTNFKRAFKKLRIAGFQGLLDPSAGGNIYIEYIEDQTLVCPPSITCLLYSAPALSSLSCSRLSLNVSMSSSSIAICCCCCRQ